MHIHNKNLKKIIPKSPPMAFLVLFRSTHTPAALQAKNLHAVANLKFIVPVPYGDANVAKQPTTTHLSFRCNIRTVYTKYIKIYCTILNVCLLHEHRP